MKHFVLVSLGFASLILLQWDTCKSQNVAINDDGALPNSNAILDIDISTNNKGILIPRLTKTQKNAISPGSGDIGLMIFQTDDAAGFWYWDGTSWRMVLADTNRITTVKRTLEIAGKGAGASKTTTVIFDNNIVEQFNIGSELYFDLPIPLDYAGGDITVYTDFVPMGAESGKSVRWNLIYKTHSSGSVLTGNTGTIDSGDFLLGSTQYLEQDIEFVIPEADLTGKEAIHFKIKRVAIGAGTNPTVDPAIVHVSILYTATH